MNRLVILGSVALSGAVYLYENPVVRHRAHQHLPYHVGIGGMGAGKALNARLLGFEVDLFAPIGDDAAGERVRAELADAGVRLHGLPDPAGTNVHVNVMAADGSRDAIPLVSPSYEPTFDTKAAIAEIRPLLAEADAVSVSINNFSRPFLPVVEDSGLPTWLDLGDFDPADPYFDDFRRVGRYATMSHSRINNLDAVLAEEAIDRDLAVVTLADQGSLGQQTEAGRWHVPADEGFPHIDANGAGDAYHVALIRATALGLPFPDAMRFATVAAGMVVASNRPCNPGLSTPALLALLAGAPEARRV